jgi:lysophospholipase
MRDLLTRINIAGFDAGAYIDKHKDNTTALPNVAIAFSGGGYRAMTNGAGALAAFDNRTPNATGSGQLGGLLQASTYIAGLSGGGWLVGSVYSNNFSSVQSIVDKNEIWQFDRSILQGRNICFRPSKHLLTITGPAQGGIQILNTVDYYSDLYDVVNSKTDAVGNFNISLTDYWGRALSFQLVDAERGGPGYTFSSIQDDDDFKNANAPMPLLVADERAPGETIISLNATNIEFNPYEMGSFDPTLYGFAPIKYLGSNFTNGKLPNSQGCIAGFDNVGFVMGTSSSLFNTIIKQLDSLGDVPDVVKSALQAVLNGLGENDDDIADYTPNPFLGFNNKTNPSAKDGRLTLVDGGLDGQNIPFNPLIQPVRAVDVIFAIDSSGDTLPPLESAQNWPNGTAIIATYERSVGNTTMQNGTNFPAVPDANTFVNLGLNNRPTFFGCDASNFTGTVPPLVVYLPNAPYVYTSNTSTTQMAYNNTERNAMIQNGYDMATQGNATLDAQWPTCVGCAMLSRSFTRNGEAVPDACKSCFDSYCWNGTIASQTPPLYIPAMKLTEINVKSAAGSFGPNVIGFAVAAALSGLFMF